MGEEFIISSADINNTTNLTALGNLTNATTGNGTTHSQCDPTLAADFQDQHDRCTHVVMLVGVVLFATICFVRQLSAYPRPKLLHAVSAVQTGLGIATVIVGCLVASVWSPQCPPHCHCIDSTTTYSIVTIVAGVAEISRGVAIRAAALHAAAPDQAGLLPGAHVQLATAPPRTPDE
mmetsp:Transcript_32101/g.76954  ORF Transcript_32101/g.76954 Transcript_32101/m.76954 type:complete len:177 (+) Transcript_32101:40-570(+)